MNGGLWWSPCLRGSTGEVIVVVSAAVQYPSGGMSRAGLRSMEPAHYELVARSLQAGLVLDRVGDLPAEGSSGAAVGS